MDANTNAVHSTASANTQNVLVWEGRHLDQLLMTFQAQDLASRHQDTERIFGRELQREAWGHGGCQGESMEVLDTSVLIWFQSAQ